MNITKSMEEDFRRAIDGLENHEWYDLGWDDDILYLNEPVLILNNLLNYGFISWEKLSNDYIVTEAGENWRENYYDNNLTSRKELENEDISVPKLDILKEIVAGDLPVKAKVELLTVISNVLGKI